MILNRTSIVAMVLLLAPVALTAANGLPSPANEQGQYRYLIEFAEPGLLRQATRERGERFDPGAGEVAARKAVLQQQHTAYRQAIAGVLDRGPRVTHYYLATHSGMAMWLSPAEAEAVRAVPGVVKVERERTYELQTYAGPWFIGADSVWDGTSMPDGLPNRGEGVIVAILDSGIDPSHPSFANDPACGHDDDTPKLLSHVDCTASDTDGACIGPSPLDTNSHGTHVASTAAGNLLDSSTIPPHRYERISGVAPCAQIRAYKVCPDISCPAALIQAGMDNVLLDGDVGVMNFSISGGNSPWTDNDRRKLDLVDAGVLVAASAGNTFPVTTENPVGAVNHKGPWVMTVAASTHDGGDVAQPMLSVDGPGADFPLETQLLAMFKADSLVGEVPDAEAFEFKPIRRPIDDAVPLDGDHGCATVYTPGYYDGAVALMLRGSPGCVLWHQYAEAAQSAGAEMVIVRNNQPGSFSFAMATEVDIPVYGISQAAGDALVAWIESLDDPHDATVRIELIVSDGEGGDTLAGFSLRGPTPSPLQNLTKPDITAPGVSIYAAEPGVPPLVSGGYGFKSGTSMSGPHSAGAAALVRAAHPDWTPPEVKSALMMTAFKGGTKTDGETPWDPDDVGSGRADLTGAALAGLVMHETFENFLAADPDEGGDVRTLNLPAVRDLGCVGSCSFTRTVRNTLGEASEWSAGGSSIEGGFNVEVTPSSFSFGGDINETRELTITIIPLEELTDEVVFGEVVLSEAGALSPDLHITAAIIGADEPIGILHVSPAALDYGLVKTGSTHTQTVLVQNNGTLAFTLTTVELKSGAPEFEITGGDCAADQELAPDASCTIEVSFQPENEGSFSGQVQVEADNGQARAIPLSGAAFVPPDAIFSDRFEQP